MLYRYLPIILFAFFFYSSGGVDKSYSQNSSETTKIEEILVEGNRRVSIGTVESYFPIKEGDSISQSTLDSALEQLYKTELFQNISLDIRGSTLIVSIVENPVINQVNIEGNDAISDEKLLEALNVQPRRVYNRKVAIDATQKLLEIYRTSGRYGAVVKPKIIKLEENRIDLVFEVNEGPLILIKSITFSGNEAFSDRKLRQVIASRQKRWWAFLASNDKYDESRLDYDVRLLRQFYLARGMPTLMYSGCVAVYFQIRVALLSLSSSMKVFGIRSIK